MVVAGLRGVFVRLWCVVASLVAVPCVLAEPEGIALDAQLPAQLAGCVTPPQLNQSYLRALAAHGGEQGRDEGPPLRAAVSYRQSDEASTILLQIALFRAERAVGMRELPVRTEDCAALPDALGLVLALLARDAGPQRTPAAAPVALPSTQIAVDEPPEPPSRPSEPAPSAHVSVGVSAGAAFGVLQSAALALQLSAATPGEHLSLRLKAGGLWPQEHAVGEGFVEARSYELGLELCGGLPWPGWPRLWLRLCGGPRVGVMLARGRDFSVDNLRARELLVYFGLTPELAFRLASATWLQLGMGAALAAVRPRFQIAVNGGRPILELSDPALARVDLMLSVVQRF